MRRIVIEWIPTPSGDLVPWCDGRFICSKVDPWKEAERWVEACAARVRDVRSAIVLGVAGGFHLSRLRQQFPHLRLVVVERHAAFAQSPSTLVRDALAGTSVLWDPAPPSVLAVAEVREAVLGLYAVLSHPQAVRIDAAYYEQIAAALLGRDPRAFNALAELRGARTKVPAESSALSARDIAAAVDLQSDPIPAESRLWLCLRELLA
jgi:hypothetical protein